MKIPGSAHGVEIGLGGGGQFLQQDDGLKGKKHHNSLIVIHILLALVCDVLLWSSLSHWYPGSGVVLDCIDLYLIFALFLTLC